MRRYRGGVRLGITRSAALALGFGVLVGGGLYAAGLGNGGGTTELSLDAVTFSSCPTGTAVGELHRGDRVLATARDESGDWLQLRDPRDLDARVWMLARFVIPDGDTKGLPVDGCAESGTLVTATTVSGPVPVPGVVAPPTTTGTGPAADTAPPGIGAATVSPSTIYDSPCNSAPTPTTSTVRVPVTDSGGVASVTIAWQLYGRSGQTTASLVDGQYQATVGPFEQPVGGLLPETANITITARDIAGNQSQSTANTILTVNSCPI